jgi:hypothetical protein
MNRKELQLISRMRRKEAAILLKEKQYTGAYYVLGYSIECALKACIAKQTQRFDFPNKEVANKAHVHNLEQLLKIAGLELQLQADIRINNQLAVNWSIAKDWNEASRYSISKSEREAKDFYTACTSNRNGILSWIKEKW